jgi:hypothetical protein
MDRMIWLVLVPLLLGQLTPASQVPSQLVVNGVRVVFFGPTPSERDSIIRVEGLAAAQLFDDFDYYGGKASAFLRTRGIDVQQTTAGMISVGLGDNKVRKIDRRSTPDAMGVILTDGKQEPRLMPGEFTDEELIAECKDFFRLK